MTRAEYAVLHGEEPPSDYCCSREWFGTVRYFGAKESLRVALISSYTPGCAELAGYPKMSSSSGPKDYLANQVYYALQASKADELVIVRGSGPQFALLRKGPHWFDIGGELIEVTRTSR